LERLLLFREAGCMLEQMWWNLALAALTLAQSEAATYAAAPLYDPVALNIGISCSWQMRCMDQQQRANRHALKYVQKYHPTLWRIQQCNRNASRYRDRVDWIGFNNCVRNARLVYVPPTPRSNPFRRPRSRRFRIHGPHRSG
jgi:hypothetical protein